MPIRPQTDKPHGNESSHRGDVIAALALAVLQPIAVVAPLFVYAMGPVGLPYVLLFAPLYYLAVLALIAGSVVYAAWCLRLGSIAAKASGATLLLVTAAHIAYRADVVDRLREYQADSRARELAALPRERCEDSARNESAEYQWFFKQPRTVRRVEADYLYFDREIRVLAPQLDSGGSYARLEGVTVEVRFPPGFKLWCRMSDDEPAPHRAQVLVNGIPVQDTELVRRGR